LYHLVNVSILPFSTSLSALVFVLGLSFVVHRIESGYTFFFFGFFLLLLCAYLWFQEVVIEASYKGNHTLVVKHGLKVGFYLFIASEIMLFFGFFWAFFHSALSPSILLGQEWPPLGIVIIKSWAYPLLNTVILVVSGLSVTWAHRAFAIGSFLEAIDSLLVTIFLGLFFLNLQLFEYYEATFNLSDGIYSCTFFLLTGLHGFHVIVGILFLFVCLIRLLLNHFLSTHYIGFVFSIWYWHFVDIVWIFLFFTVYCWGGLS
jgi:heme/copper-type cytochrome/quinol oxidase subunit 3